MIEARVMFYFASCFRFLHFIFRYHVITLPSREKRLRILCCLERSNTQKFGEILS